MLSELLRLYEVDNLKATLRGFIIGESWDRVRHTLYPLGNFGSLPYETLMNAATLEEAIDQLKGTVYYSALSNALVRYNQEKNLFVLEVALDLDYWNRLWKNSQKLPASDQTHVRKLVGTLMDMNTFCGRFAIAFIIICLKKKSSTTPCHLDIMSMMNKFV